MSGLKTLQYLQDNHCFEFVHDSALDKCIADGQTGLSESDMVQLKEQAYVDEGFEEFVGKVSAFHRIQNANKS